MIFENAQGKLKRVGEKEFNLEKDIQTLIETNMLEIFGFEFLATEFPIENFRFDSVAFDVDNNAFVIIEYKKGKSESLVDQGLAYLNTLLTRKAEFVLLYNEIKGASRLVKDFDWSQTKLLFISPRFTNYQLKSVAFKNFANFHLFEIKRFENNLLQICEKEVERYFDANLENFDATEFDTIKKEIFIHTEEEHLVKGNDFTRELYLALRERILELGDVRIEPKQQYIAFKARTNVCDIIIHKNDISVMINLQAGELIDNNRTARLMKNNGERIGHWGNGDYQVKISNIEEIDYLITLLRQSFKKNSL